MTVQTNAYKFMRKCSYKWDHFNGSFHTLQISEGLSIRRWIWMPSGHRLTLTSAGALMASALFSSWRCLYIRLTLQKQCHPSLKEKKKKEASLSPFYCVVRVGSGLLGKCRISNMKCLEVHSLSFPKIDISQDKKENCFFTWRRLQEAEMEVWQVAWSVIRHFN